MFGFKQKASSGALPGKEGQGERGAAGLKHLDRIRLMELIVEQRKRIEELEEKLEEAERRLKERTIRLDVQNVNKTEDLARTLRSVLEELGGTFEE